MKILEPPIRLLVNRTQIESTNTNSIFHLNMEVPLSTISTGNGQYCSRYFHRDVREEVVPAMNTLSDTMHRLSLLLWNAEKKTVFGKNGVAWCSIALGTFVVVVVIGIFAQSIRDVKKARQDLQTQHNTPQQQPQSQQYVAPASTQEHPQFSTSTDAPTQIEAGALLRPPREALEFSNGQMTDTSINEADVGNVAAGGSKVLKKREDTVKQSDKDLLEEVRTTTEDLPLRFIYRNFAAFSALEAIKKKSAENEASVSDKKQPIKANLLRSVMLKPVFDERSPIIKRNSQVGRQLTSDVNRFIVQPKEFNPQSKTRFGYYPTSKKAPGIKEQDRYSTAKPSGENLKLQRRFAF